MTPPEAPPSLQQALRTGRLKPAGTGGFRLPRRFTLPAQLQIRNHHRYDCGFLNQVMFALILEGRSLPQGCTACYKLRIETGSLAALLTLTHRLENSPFIAKCGIDWQAPPGRTHVAVIYGDSLETVRAARAALLPDLAACGLPTDELTITLRRGCANYEDTLGPPPDWRNDPAASVLEQQLSLKFQRRRPLIRRYRWRKLISLSLWLILSLLLPLRAHRPAPFRHSYPPEAETSADKDRRP